MNNELKRFVQDELEQVTVKIATGADIKVDFQGTGFFITPAGYILTAWHCIKDAFNFGGEIYVECHDGKRLSAQVVEDKSAESLDIAVLKVNCENRKNGIPLGIISKQHKNTPVVSVGFPGIDKIDTDIGSIEGEILRLVGSDDIEIHNAILGPGQSGGLIYHYATHRIVGVVKDISNILRTTGSAVKFDCLFQKWSEFAEINEKMALSWDKRLNKKRNERRNEKRQVVKPLGPLLWYLTNRIAQEMKLEEAIQLHLADPDNKKRPLLCLVHGDECEYDSLIEWFKYVIPGMIRQPIPTVIPVRTGEVQKVSDLHNYILLNLKNELITPEQKLGTEKKEIEKTLAKNIALKNHPVIVHLSLHTEDDRSLLGKKLIEDGFINFWAQWQPDEQQNQLLLVFLLFKYKAEKKTFWQRLLNQSVNKKIKHTFDNLKELSFSEKFAVNGLVLPKLDRIKKRYVTDWVEKYYEGHLSKFCDDKQALICAIDELYEPYQDGISMRKLGPELKKIVSSN